MILRLVRAIITPSSSWLFNWKMTHSSNKINQVLWLSLCNRTKPFYIENVRNYAKKSGKDPKGKLSKPRVVLSMDEMLEVIRVDVLEKQLKQTVEKLKETFNLQLSNRNTTSGLEGLSIKIDEDEFPLNEIAQIAKKNPQLIVVNLSSFPEGLKGTMHAIQTSGMNVGVQQDGTMIYITLPKVTREHREAQVKSAKAIFNKHKDEIREVQNKFVRDAKRKTDLSEDLVFNVVEQIKWTADHHIIESEKILVAKEKELLGENQQN